MLYFSNARASLLCVAFPKNSPGRISTGAPCTWMCVLSQSDDSAELLHVESDKGVDILSDLEIRKEFRPFSINSSNNGPTAIVVDGDPKTGRKEVGN